MSNAARSVPPRRGCPTRAEAEALALRLLWDHGTRWPHIQAAGFVATGVAHLVGADEGALLVSEATLHGTGYSARVSQTGSGNGRSQGLAVTGLPLPT